MNNEIDIHKECIEFVTLQVNGKCNAEEQKRLTLAKLNPQAKKLLSPFQDLLYFGNPLNYSSDQLEASKKVLLKLKTKVTPPEMNLINYLSLIISGSQDSATFQNLQRYYNQSIIKHQKYLTA